MTRLPLLRRNDLDETQHALFDALTSGPRGVRIVNTDGSLLGPYNAWLYSPAIGDAAQQLGAALRFRSSLPPPLLELAIIITAREWTAQFEWWAHARLAARAGLAQEVIAAIKERRRPAFAVTEQAAIYDFCRELLDTHRVSDPVYAQAITLLGEAGVLELVSLMGYYGLISMTLNTFEVPLPEGEAKPLEET
jgi:4-carboxymuconolactone decarboxylase